ncbi:unnamed protein product [Cyprideis torosa]|uniref:Uncharacterized protein n=1 Tax=Cyprideis torosa TaxID=163714 RepID=A0A7R8WF42_9CRUS|nr:unnamed protein product [Cyprideis torosa]CAG0896562.1 unnamed protein product [Cyprideis torosa]
MSWFPSAILIFTVVVGDIQFLLEVHGSPQRFLGVEDFNEMDGRPFPNPDDTDMLPQRGQECNRACPRDYNPVCGTDGQDYANICLLNEERCVNNKPELFARFSGTCDSPPDPPLPEDIDNFCLNPSCMTDPDPVCGSDGVTYRNTCYFAMAYCKDRNLEFVSNGECDRIVNPIAGGGRPPRGRRPSSRTPTWRTRSATQPRTWGRGK